MDIKEREALREKREKLNAEVAANWDNPEYRKQMEASITETIYEGFEHENLLNLMSDVDNVGFDDRSYVKEVKGLMAHWLARGGYIESSQMRSDIFEVPRDTIGFHVFEFEDKVQTNFAETQATLVNLGIQRLDGEINKRFLSAMQIAIPNGSSNYTSGAGLSLSALNAAIREVQDASSTGQVTIVGRSTMTQQIIDALEASGVSISPETSDEMLRRGVLATYRGAQIVSLRNHKDGEDRSFFPANELFVVARDASKTAFFGGLLSKSFDEQDNWYWHYLARRDFGVVVHRADRAHRIVDTSQAA